MRINWEKILLISWLRIVKSQVAVHKNKLAINLNASFQTFIPFDYDRLY